MIYQLTNNGIKRLADSAFIPIDAGNSDYQAYLAWVAQGNIALAKDTPSKAELNAVALSNLAAIDAKKIRALTDAILNNDKTDLLALEVQAVAERAKILK